MLHPTDTHLYSPLGDSRERRVPCRDCRRDTGNICAYCNTHCTCPEAAQSRARQDARTMADDVHAAMAEVVASIPDGTDPDVARDITATAGMARLMADTAAEHPQSSTAWTMLTSALAAVRVKTGTLLAVAAVMVGLMVAPSGTGSAAAASSPNPKTTTTTTTTTTVTKVTTTTTTTVPVVRRQSVVTGTVNVAGWAGTPGYGMVNVMVQTRHRTPSGYVASAYSPVNVQRLVGRTWRTVATVTTGRDGLAFRTYLAPSGTQSYRFVRPQGATVTAATSMTMVAYVPSTPGC
jgi:hypothetical protein